MKAIIQKVVTGSVFLLVCAAMSITSQAATYTMDANTVYEVAGSPSSPGGDLTTTFQDVSGGVQMTVAVSGLAQSYYNVNTWWFMVNNTFANSLTFTEQSASSGVTLPAISERATPTSEAGNNGYFNVWFNTFNGNFGNGDSITYLITSTTAGLTAAAFNVKDSPTSGSYGSGGAYYTAIQVNAGASGGSYYFWLGSTAATLVPVPEPGSSSFVVLGLAIGLGAVTRKMRKISVVV